MLAITGATGFVGQAVVDAALAAGHRVQALARRTQPPRDGITWVEGALDVPAALDVLCAGADAVIHIAGAVNVPTRAAFAAANVAGTAAVVEAAITAGIARFVHVSSLAAREPGLSDYGWSKAGAETIVDGSGLDWTIVRPPGVYGPRDGDMLELFRMATRGTMLLPPKGRGSWIHVDDLAQALLSNAAAPIEPVHQMYEIAGDPPTGTSHRDLAGLIARAVGRPGALQITAPAWAIHLAARADRLVRGDAARLTPDRARYMVHPDWVSDPARAMPTALWRPQVPLAAGLAATAAWYRANGWLL